MTNSSVETISCYADILVLIARLALGVFFLSSSVGKLRDLDGFVQGVLNYRVLPSSWAHRLGIILPWIEVFIALALLFGIALLFVSSVAIILLLCFIVAVAVNLQRGRAIPCNCHGIAGTKTISRGTIARNCLLLFFALILIVSVSIGNYLTPMHTNPAIITDLPSAILVVLLVIFCLAFVLLIEWAIDISTRIAQIRR